MKLRPFELTLVVIFGLLMVLALILLRTYTPDPDENVVSLGGPVTIWGTLPEEGISSLIGQLGVTNESYQNVSYHYIPADRFNETLINALADNNSPDLLLISQESLVELRSRLKSFPLATFPVDRRSTYIEGTDVFALSDGMYGFPVAVDPLVMYWNRDLFSFKNLLTAPKTWEEIVGEIVPELTVLDSNRTIRQSAVAMGEYSNIKNAFPTISMLLLQGGSSMVTERSATYSVLLDEMKTSGGRPFTLALTFYTNFNSVGNTLYSWNRALSLDRDLFLRDELALYFGFGSEAQELETKNPNLNFDIAEVPQGAAATTKRTYGRVYSLALLKAAKNAAGGYTVMQELGSQSNAKKIADSYGMAPVHKSSLAAGSNDVFGRMIYTSALQARGWLNPPVNDTDEIFTKLLSDISSDRSKVSNVVGDAAERIRLAY